jgi:hypothetical protein
VQLGPSSRYAADGDGGTITGMKNRRWGRRLLVAGIWAMAMSTWSSIGHYLFGLVDLGLPLATAAVVAVLAWPLPVRRGIGAATATLAAEQGRRSRP